MLPIPKKIRNDLSRDDWYTRCCYCGISTGIQWHHAIEYKGARLQKAWAIVPACEDHHIEVKTKRIVREYFEWIALNRAKDFELQEISKVINWFHVRELLNKKFNL